MLLTRSRLTSANAGGDATKRVARARHALTAITRHFFAAPNGYRLPSAIVDNVGIETNMHCFCGAFWAACWEAIAAEAEGLSVRARHSRTRRGKQVGFERGNPMLHIPNPGQTGRRVRPIRLVGILGVGLLQTLSYKAAATENVMVVAVPSWVPEATAFRVQVHGFRAVKEPRTDNT